MSSNSDNPRLYYGAYGVCRDPSDRILLVHIASGLDEGLWAIPGGGIEWGEHPDAALHRELEEETGVTEITTFQVIAVYSQVYKRSVERPYDPVHHIGIIYDVTLDSFDLTPEKNGSTNRCEWFTKDQARQLPLTLLGEFALNLA